MPSASCRETGDVQVTSIEFRGNAVKADELKAIIATRESGFLPWSRKRFFDRPEFDQDVKRIEAFYADRGFPKAKVVGVDVALNEAKDKVAITVEINEGEPMIVEDVTFDGFDAVPADHLERLEARLPIRAGQPRDSAAHPRVSRHGACRAARSRIPLRQHPHGRAPRLVRDAGPDSSVAADTGPQAVFGPVIIEGDVSVDEDVVRRELAFREGISTS